MLSVYLPLLANAPAGYLAQLESLANCRASPSAQQTPSPPGENGRFPLLAAAPASHPSHPEASANCSSDSNALHLPARKKPHEHSRLLVVDPAKPPFLSSSLRALPPPVLAM